VQQAAQAAPAADDGDSDQDTGPQLSPAAQPRLIEGVCKRRNIKCGWKKIDFVLRMVRQQNSWVELDWIGLDWIGSDRRTLGVGSLCFTADWHFFVGGTCALRGRLSSFAAGMLVVSVKHGLGMVEYACSRPSLPSHPSPSPHPCVLTSPSPPSLHPHLPLTPHPPPSDPACHC
jgi:hypothetical protein